MKLRNAVPAAEHVGRISNLKPTSLPSVSLIGADPLLGYSDHAAALEVTCPLSCSVMSSLAVVCGGSRGIGKAVSRLLAERGCRLAVVSRNEDAARATAASLPGGT